LERRNATVSTESSGLFPNNKKRIQKPKEKNASLPDKHAECPETRIRLPIVGLSHLEKWFKAEIAGEIGILKVDIDATIDLPSDRRGFNISRHNEVIDEIAADWHDSKRPKPFESLAELIAQQLLVRHEYSTESFVSIRTPYPYSHKTPNGITTQQNCRVISKAWAHRQNGKPVVTRRGISVQIQSVLACPMAKAMIKEDSKLMLAKLQLSNELSEKLLELPLGTHMERCFSTLEIDTSGKFDFTINDLITILENAASAPLFEVLKRPDELEVVKILLKKNRFVEDCIREVAFNTVKLCRGLPKETLLKIDFESLFPLSKYHVISKIESTLGEIEKEVQCN
jgi:GTP cyclohydrolase-4